MCITFLIHRFDIREDEIVLDHYIAAYSYVEWAMIYFSKGQYDHAKKKLEETR